MDLCEQCQPKTQSFTAAELTGLWDSLAQCCQRAKLLNLHQTTACLLELVDTSTVCINSLLAFFFYFRVVKLHKFHNTSPSIIFSTSSAHQVQLNLIKASFIKLWQVQTAVGHSSLHIFHQKPTQPPLVLLIPDPEACKKWSTFLEQPNLLPASSHQESPRWFLHASSSCYLPCTSSHTNTHTHAQIHTPTQEPEDIMASVACRSTWIHVKASFSPLFLKTEGGCKQS